jgi:hypothetical protein
MSIGIYIRVASGVGGTIYASNETRSWSTTKSTKQGNSDFPNTGQTKFTATAASGYKFDHFSLYSADNLYANAPNWIWDDKENPMWFSDSLLESGGSYLVEAVFTKAKTYHTVTVRFYKDGTYYDYNSYDIEEGGNFYVGSYVDCPDGYALNYVYYGGNQYAYYPTFTIKNSITIYVYFKSRPSNWSWTSTIATGCAINISAFEWNAFTSKINAFRSYLGLSSYSFTTVYSGDAITTTICNQAHTAVSEMSGYQSTYSMPSAVTSVASLPASFFNGLKNVMNAIQ